MEGFGDRRSLQAWMTVAPEDVPQSARGIYLRLAARGWAVGLLHAVTLHKASVYAASSETNAKGDLKKAAHVVDHFALRATLDHEGRSAARLLAIWRKERPVEGKKTSAAFVDAHSWDVVQNEIEFHRNATGLEGWVSVFAPKPEPKKKKTKEPEPDVLAVELAGGVWNG